MARHTSSEQLARRDAKGGGSKMSVVTRLRKQAIALFVVVAALLGVATFEASPASASAYSCTGYGYGFSWGYPSQFCGQTIGSGTYVQTAGAGYSAPIAWAGWLTNTRVRVEFYNQWGQVYWSATSGQQNGGSAVGAWKWGLYRYMQPGYVKYTLLSNGAYIASVEQRIY